MVFTELCIKVWVFISTGSIDMSAARVFTNCFGHAFAVEHTLVRLGFRWQAEAMSRIGSIVGFRLDEMLRHRGEPHRVVEQLLVEGFCSDVRDLLTVLWHHHRHKDIRIVNHPKP